MKPSTICGRTWYLVCRPCVTAQNPPAWCLGICENPGADLEERLCFATEQVRLLAWKGWCQLCWHLRVQASSLTCSLSSKSALWFSKNVFPLDVPMDKACLVKTFQAIVDLVVIFFKATLFRLLRSLLGPFVQVAGNQFGHKSRPQLFARDTGPLLHQWQQMCTVHLAHDLRLIDIYIYSTSVTLQWNLQCVVQIRVLPPFPYLIHCSPASVAYFLRDFIVGFLCCPPGRFLFCPSGRCLVGWLFRFHHRRRGVTGQKLKVVMRITTRCHPDAVRSPPHPFHPWKPASLWRHAPPNQLGFASSTGRREKATLAALAKIKRSIAKLKDVFQTIRQTIVGLLRQTRNDQAVPKYHAYPRMKSWGLKILAIFFPFVESYRCSSSHGRTTQSKAKTCNPRTHRDHPIRIQSSGKKLNDFSRVPHWTKLLI